jgi:hypothetical protein
MQCKASTAGFHARASRQQLSTGEPIVFHVFSWSNKIAFSPTILLFLTSLIQKRML